MGKQGHRRKKQKANRQRRQQQVQQSLDVVVAGAADLSTTTNSVNPHSAVHQLRNPDPKVRHAALVALQASVLSQLTSSSKPIALPVLQAVREQVSNPDLECSAVAAECLAHYLSMTSAHTETDTRKEMTASWALILLGRLQECRTALVGFVTADRTTASLSKNQHKKRDTQRKQWYAIAAPCFQALCSLIEENGYALDRINLQKKTFVEVIFGMLVLLQAPSSSSSTATVPPVDTTNTPEDAMMQDPTDVTANTASSVVNVESDTLAEEYRTSTALYAARCLHSALDENHELAEVLQHSDNLGMWNTLLDEGGGGPTTLGFSTITRLHLLGCLVNLYQMTAAAALSSPSWCEQLLLEYGILGATRKLGGEAVGGRGGLFLTTLGVGNTDVSLYDALSLLELKYREAQHLWERQNEDQKMEEEIAAKVNERKEPAKEIAKRQKKNKAATRLAYQEEQKAKMIAEAEATAIVDTEMIDASGVMTEEAVEERPKKPHSGTIVREQNGEEAMHAALSAWHTKLKELQLTLEILTNLVSTWIIEDDEDPRHLNQNTALHHALRDHYTTAQLSGLLDTHPHNNSTSTHINTVRHALRGQQTAVHLSELLTTLCTYLQQGVKKSAAAAATSSMIEGDGNTTPLVISYAKKDPMKLDVEETISKLSACLINCILSNVVIVWDDGDEASTTFPITKWYRFVAACIDADSNRNTATTNNCTDAVDIMGDSAAGGTNNTQHTANNNDDDVLISSIIALFAVIAKKNCGIFNPILLFENTAISILQHTLPRRDTVCLLSSIIYAGVTTMDNTNPTGCHVLKELRLNVSQVTSQFITILMDDVDPNNNNNNTENHPVPFGTKLEILRTFMDWYGNDDFYPDIYNELQVSRSIALFLQVVASIEGSGNPTQMFTPTEFETMEIDEEQMRMILSNTARFVDYKQQLLMSQQQQQK